MYRLKGARVPGIREGSGAKPPWGVGAKLQKSSNEDMLKPDMDLRNRFLPALLIGLLQLTPASAASSRKSSLGLATVSMGTWAVYGDLDGFVPKPFPGGRPDALVRYEFNKLAVVGLYGTVLGQPAFLSVPWLWTSKRLESGSQDRIALGDAEFYVGQRAGISELRLGLIFPAGYDTHDGDPWIGSGNVQVTLGAALNPNITRYSKRWEVSTEVKWAYAVDDAIAKAGSWALSPSGKISFRPTEKWRAGVEALGYWKSNYWGRSANFSQAVFGRAGAKAEWKAGVVPNLFVEDFLTPNFAVGGKAGYSLWGYKDASSYNASIYILYFP